MAYDWKKIFANKTDKELYEIYSGNSFLPHETVEYARQELERRRFDFNDIESSKSAWKLSELLIEAESAQQVLEENKILPYRSLYFLIPGIFLAHVVLTMCFNVKIPIYLPILMTGLTLWYVIITNTKDSKQREEQTERFKRINEIKEKLEKNVPVEKFDYVKKDIARSISENSKNKKFLIWIFIIFVLLFLLMKITGIFE